MNKPTVASPDELLKRLHGLLKRIHAQFDEIDAIRERCFELSRKLIRQSGKAVKHAHFGERERAKKELEKATCIAKELCEIASSNQIVLSWGFVQDAQREFAEAALFFAIAFGDEIPTPEELNVQGVAYINGLAEAMGEVRKLILDKLDDGEWETIRNLLGIMEGIYFELQPFDHSDAITLGLRRRFDQLRTSLERTQGEVALASRCAKLTELLTMHSRSKGEI